MAKDQASGPLVDTATDDKTTRAVRCRACDASITERRHALEVSGAHRHVFQNPAGLVYEIVCFVRSDGAATLAEPTLEATWFEGHAWSFALCRRCGTHLGWAYWQTNEIRFWGLIAERLLDDGT